MESNYLKQIRKRTSQLLKLQCFIELLEHHSDDPVAKKIMGELYRNYDENFEYFCVHIEDYSQELMRSLKPKKM